MTAQHPAPPAHWFEDCPDRVPDAITAVSPAEVTCLTCMQDMLKSGELRFTGEDGEPPW